MSLKDYRHKRKFDITSEPSGQAPVHAGHRFVVQKHAASRLHYDFRLESEGVLKSWAVPHGPCLDPSVKALAVEVEDHPIDYADFEGTIPAGQYGGGTVMVWDRGTWEPYGDEDLERGLKRGKATFVLHGEKLSGAWALVRMKSQGEKNWLLIKKQDEFAVSRKKNDITVSAPKSVLTGRDLSQIADGEKPLRGSRKQTRKPAGAKSASAKQSSAKAQAKKSAGGKTAARSRASVKRTKLSAAVAKRIAEHLRQAPEADSQQLDSFRPQLATLSSTIPEGDRWLHELKLDGYRILARKSGDKVQLLTRKGLDWADHFPDIAQAVAGLPLDDAILDGEVVALDEKGVSDFQRLQNSMAEANQASLVYYVFDLPFAEQHDLTSLPLIERKDILAQILRQHLPDNDGIVRYHDHILGSGSEVLQQACHYAMEGVVSKNINSPYVSRRSETWLKVKCLHNQEFVIAGFTKPAGERTGFGALLLGYYQGKDLVYCGRVGTGFTELSLRELTRRLKSIETDECPYAKTPQRSQLRGVRWVEPELVAEISYATITDEGLLRHAVFHGLREDKPARQVVLEKPVARPKSDRSRVISDASSARTTKEARKRKSTRAAPSKGRSVSGGASDKGKSAVKRRAAKKDIGEKKTAKKRGTARKTLALKPAQALELAQSRISHPERVVYLEPELKKIDVARYLLEVAPWMLPGVAGRPLTLLRCPRGAHEQCFFQKHLDGEFPEGIRGVEIDEDKKRDTYAVVEDVSGLLSLAQMNALEIHLWPALADDVEHPDQMVFDLDPGPGVAWSWVIEGARDIRKMLKQVGLESFVRTSGGKGLHVVAPFERQSGDWDSLKQFASLVAHTLASQHPDRYLATMSKSLRRGKVFIDYLRNQRGATAVASYSPRARVGAGVATPLSWRELSEDLTSSTFTIENVLQRLKRKSRDPWEGFDELDQQLPNGRASTVPSTKSRRSAKTRKKPARKG